jgi:hypothetical protein
VVQDFPLLVATGVDTLHLFDRRKWFNHDLVLLFVDEYLS